ncbi:hypothetical protein PLESTB_000363500 [Pleodorina starrii]|uniref:Enoyl reductase (ER) domain-containing protein n=1 Tax=Pleodorina starrii TaxID=330485 RepID=A0A9W6EZ68_9CHLO|nr:hypothetical protein PLESTM_000031700 [Pleodorina starrii]GLC50294.1 hypothetical protein PLESTB_000363500 [Pleodorina starrii]GLC64322.1 hypothetical protein PLESTF_000149100 [Pleodorina starrii]
MEAVTRAMEGLKTAVIGSGSEGKTQVDTGGNLQDLMGHPLESNTQRSGGNLGGKVIRTSGGVTVTSNKDPDHTMRAVCWEGPRKIVVEERPRPMITDPHDAVVRVTSTAICGSDLHLYLGSAPGMQKGDILGHEFMGIVETVGPEVRNVRPGDRVVASFDIACGGCRSCGHGAFSSCDITNPSKDQEMLYGARTAGLFGYAHVTGGYEGGQADYVRVPFADHDLIHVPEDLPDNKVLFLSDIMSTAWFATELGEVGPGKTVAIWGAGPVGILAAHSSQVRGADKVILIDNQQYRLDHAATKLPGLLTINFGKEKVKEALEQVVPGGPDVCIEAVGFHYCKSTAHAAMVKTLMETDTADILNELIYCCRKGGTIACVGVYVGLTNGFNIGAFMEKGLTLKAGQTPVQKFWHKLLDMIKGGKLDPTIVITHELPVEDAPQAYKMFNDKTDGCIKVVLKTSMARSQATGPPSGP